ncbi:sequence-specific DNA binding RNA polymerase II transcription factor [Ascochyta rabiei]|uniref:Sequence-specific DNA binding RNA polymerase II transcription factor n=1 Tax=Didymella rabiei TaxID=5454 RepID=A0A163HI40_DIDRA|nr:sequence-specific DNA binding RNA polymerase II transcription factor [Ascochyta rabiei]
MPIALTYNEALLFHHFTTHLGRWMDCTNAARIFTLSVSEKARESPVLCHAVLCFAARHRRDDSTAEASYERCVNLLIGRLDGDSASYDDMLLAAVLLLHFAEQLNGKLPRAGRLDSLRLPLSSPHQLRLARQAPFERDFKYSPCFSEQFG